MLKIILISLFLFSCNSKIFGDFHESTLTIRELPTQKTQSFAGKIIVQDERKYPQYLGAKLSGIEYYEKCELGKIGCKVKPFIKSKNDITKVIENSIKNAIIENNLSVSKKTVINIKIQQLDISLHSALLGSQKYTTTLEVNVEKNKFAKTFTHTVIKKPIGFGFFYPISDREHEIALEKSIYTTIQQIVEDQDFINAIK